MKVGKKAGPKGPAPPIVPTVDDYLAQAKTLYSELLERSHADVAFELAGLLVKQKMSSDMDAAYGPRLAALDAQAEAASAAYEKTVLEYNEQLWNDAKHALRDLGRRGGKTRWAAPNELAIQLAQAAIDRFRTKRSRAEIARAILPELAAHGIRLKATNAQRTVTEWITAGIDAERFKPYGKPLT